jgi:hypothetical protein
VSRHQAFRFALAAAADEPEVRALAGSVVVPGDVAVRFERQPDYFLGCSVQGDPCDVLTARHEPGGELAAVAVRAERRVYLNGQETRVAYVGQIRIAPRFQGRWLSHRAAAEFAALRDPATLIFGVIARDNPLSRGTLTGPRPPGAPIVRRAAALVSHAHVLHRRGPPRRPVRRRGGGLDLRPAGPGDLDELVAFLTAHGPSRQFFPVVRVEDLVGGRTFRGLALEDICLAWRGGAIVGVLGAWDQTSYKQEVVAGWSPSLARLHPAWDTAARLLGAAQLPRPGQPIRTGYAALGCVAGDDPTVWRALVAMARDRAREQGLAFFMTSLDERDPLRSAAGRTLRVTYRSDLFVASFAGRDPDLVLDGRPVHLENGAL